MELIDVFSNLALERSAFENKCYGVAMETKATKQKKKHTRSGHRLIKSLQRYALVQLLPHRSVYREKKCCQQSRTHILVTVFSPV